MAQPLIEPITTEALPEFAAFLNLNLDTSRSKEAWIDGLKKSWGMEAPNHGYMIRDNGKIVGGIGAYYATRPINGKSEKTCNITSWCVLDAYRKQSMRLAMAVVGQKDMHFTDFSPTKVVGGVLQFLKFRPLDERQAVILNLPLPSFGSRLVSRFTEIEANLTGTALQIFRDHAVFPWLNQLLIGTEGNWCNVIYKRVTFKRLPAAQILYLSDRVVFDRHFRRLSSHFLFSGLISTHVECRFLMKSPWPSAIRSGFNAKVYLSPTLTDQDIDYLYSETMALDL